MVRGYAGVGLYHPKNIINVGSVLRAASAYGAALVIIEGKRYRRQPTDTWAAYRHMPLIESEDMFAVTPYDCQRVAVDLVDDAEDLVTFKHPERAIYIFGPEDGTLGKRVEGECE